MTWTDPLIIFALGTLVVALILFWVYDAQRKHVGLPAGSILYTDMRAWKKAEQPLYDPELALTGKPDYLVLQEGCIIPVEVKSGHTPRSPHDSHILQLAAYCLLTEKNYKKRPPFGIIHYPGQDFTVEFTPELEALLKRVMAELRLDDRKDEVHRSHKESPRCRHCGFRTNCDQRLG